MRVVCEGLAFPEGPVWHPRAGLLVTEIVGQRVSRVADGRFTVLAVTGGGANGMTLGPDGHLYVTNNGGIAVGWSAPEPIGGRVQRVTLDGQVSDVATRCGDRDLVSPNDCCFGPDGLLYFTDPRWTHDADMGRTPGHVLRTDLEGHVELLAEGPLFANGIGFGPDRRRLFVAETYAQRVLTYPWSPQGLGAPEEFCRLPDGFPDGFCFDAAGRLYVAATFARGIQVFDADGTHLELLETGEGTMPTNCCFGPDGTLYVTDSLGGRVLAFDLGVEGLPLL